MHTTLFTLDPTNYIGINLHSNNVFVCIIRNATDSQDRLRKKSWRVLKSHWISSSGTLSKG